MKRALIVLLLLGVTACSGSTTESPDRGRVPSISTLIAKADLAPCPPASRSGHGALPHITLPCLGAGPAVDLANLQGKPLLVNIWASTCAPCQRESPDLQRIYASAQGRLDMLGIDFGDFRDSALDFAAHVGMHYPSVFDHDQKVQGALHVVGLPITLFIDAQGRIVGREIGQYQGIDKMRADINHYLGVRV